MSNDSDIEKAVISGLFRQHKIFMYDWGEDDDSKIPRLRETCGVCGDWRAAKYPWYSGYPGSKRVLVADECPGEPSFSVIYAGDTGRGSLKSIKEAYARSKSAGRPDDAGLEACP